MPAPFVPPHDPIAPTSGSPPDHEHHPTTKTLDYFALGCILAPAPEVIGLYLRSEHMDWGRVVISFVVSTAIGIAVLWLARSWRYLAAKGAALDNYFLGRAAIIAFFMLIPSLTAPFFEGSPPAASQTGYDALELKLGQSTSDLAAAHTERDQLKQQLAASQSQLQDTKSQLEAARRTLHQPAPPPPPEDQIPITWQPDFQLNWNGSKKSS